MSLHEYIAHAGIALYSSTQLQHGYYHSGTIVKRRIHKHKHTQGNDHSRLYTSQASRRHLCCCAVAAENHFTLWCATHLFVSCVVEVWVVSIPVSRQLLVSCSRLQAVEPLCLQHAGSKAGLTCAVSIGQMGYQSVRALLW